MTSKCDVCGATIGPPERLWLIPLPSITLTASKTGVASVVEKRVNVCDDCLLRLYDVLDDWTTDNQPRVLPE